MRMPLIWPCRPIVSAVDMRCDTFRTDRVITEEEATDGSDNSKGNGFNATFGAIDANGTDRESVTRA